MRCLTPIRIKDKGVDVPCGKCYPCLSNRRINWLFRLKNEQKVSKCSHFVTLTYNDENLPLYLAPGDVQTFFKALRYQIYKKCLKTHENIKIKYFCVGEYGDKSGRPHFHLIIFNNPYKELYQDIWKKGFVSIGSVTTESIHYCTKYCMKLSDKPTVNLMSKSLGINYYLANGHRHKKLMDFSVRIDNNRYSMPRYLKDKIFSISEKEENKRKYVTESDLRIQNDIAIKSDYFPRELMNKIDIGNRINNIKKQRL